MALKIVRKKRIKVAVSTMYGYVYWKEIENKNGGER